MVASIANIYEHELVVPLQYDHNSIIILKSKKKSKAIPVTGRGGL
jgi:hypothetical protein